jgi:mono/diheme cytochrome c family protein
LRAALMLVLALLFASWLSRPRALDESDLPAHEPDAVAGERWFLLGSCASCHATPVDGRRAKGDNRLRLGGGLELDTAFGVFRVPNISSDPADGIGRWSMVDFANAMQHGVSPDRRHYYPAFPYPSYARMNVEDVMDLRAYLASLPAVAGRQADHSLEFPWSLRPGIGLWKLRYLDTRPVADIDSANTAASYGQTLVEGAGHCGECHTPRDVAGGLRRDRWLSGAPSLEGKGRVPDITPGSDEVGDWSAADLAYYFESGFTPDYDTVGGSMVAVQENLAALPAEDREAIAAYLKAVPARAD